MIIEKQNFDKIFKKKQDAPHLLLITMQLIVASPALGSKFKKKLHF